MNSLTANNRLSQQLVVSVAEHLLLRHECRLPNLLAVSNHRELYLTVGGELCRNLTAGFVTEEDFMFMLFVGSQKHSALSIFAKTTRMSALALCGNSGVILLSVKDHQHIDSAIPGRYTVQAPYKAGAGIGVLELHTATIGALASFCCYNSAIPKLWWAGWGHRKVRRFPYAPVTPTLLSSPPAKLAFPVVEVIHCIRRLPSWLLSQPSLV